MYTSIRAINDATIYEQYPTINAGIDSYLEVATTVESNTKYATRNLVKFDTLDITNKIAQLNIQNPKYRLKLYISDESEIYQDYKLVALPISESWANGLGRYYNYPNTTEPGVCWSYKNGTTPWGTGSYYTTPGGGTWNTSSQYICTQSFSYDDNHDTGFDVTSIVEGWLTGSIDNNGIIIKYTDDIEYIVSESSNIKFYSRDTNTIYQPILEILSDDFEFNNSTETYFNETIYASQSSLFPTLSLDTSFTNSGSYDYETLIINSSSQYKTVTSSSNIGPIQEYLAGPLTTGSISGFYINGNYTGSFIGYMDTTTFTGSLYDATFTGVIRNNSDTEYYPTATSISRMNISGSIQGIITASNIYNSSFNDLTISGSYTGSFNINSYEQLSRTTSSYTITVPAQIFTYEHFASQSYYITGSEALSPVNEIQSTVVSVSRLQQNYKQESVIMFRLHARDQYPALAYTTRSAYLQETYYLPMQSYYAIKDVISNQYIIDFDTDYTRISCDASSNYFILDCNTLYPERYYEIQIKSITSDNEKYFTGYQFKIIK